LHPAQKSALQQKRKHLQMQLQATEYINSGIKFHWLDYYNNIKALHLQCNIEWLCAATQAEQPYFAAAIKALDHPDLKPEMVMLTKESLLVKICKDFPSISHFKYVMDLPLLIEYERNTKEAMLLAQEQLKIEDSLVYFLSTDCCPLLQLHWAELLEHSNEIFDNSPTSLIFTDLNYNWIIFRSIENEWRCGFTNKE
jgi:hypothetical protein